MYIELDLAKPTKGEIKTIDGYVGVAPEAVKDLKKFKGIFII